jgi:replicative DNA helicase
MEIRSKARRLKSKEPNLALIIVDYLQLMTSGSNPENRVQEVSQISRNLKVLARDLDVPVIALSQLSRAVEQRHDKRPILSDLRESGCLAGDSRVYLPDEGVYRPIRELEGQSGFRVLAADDETHRLEPRGVTRAFATGRKPVYRLTTRLGRTIRATGNHKFLAFDGWRRLDDMGPGMEIAAPRELRGPVEQTMSDEKLAVLGHLLRHHPGARDQRIPPEVFAQPPAAIGIFLRHLCATEALLGSAGARFVYPISFSSSSAELICDLQSLLLRVGITATRQADSSQDGTPSHRLDIIDLADLERYVSLAGLAEQRASVEVAVGGGDRALLEPRRSSVESEVRGDGGSSDVEWDEIVSIEPDGEDDVYDLTVEGLHSFVAEDVVVHNSLEQDADLVFFIYRDEYYNDETEAQGIAEVHLAKHRNGPTGTEKLAWLNRYAKFADLAPAS